MFYVHAVTTEYRSIEGGVGVGLLLETYFIVFYFLYWWQNLTLSLTYSEQNIRYANPCTTAMVQFAKHS